MSIFEKWLTETKITNYASLIKGAPKSHTENRNTCVPLSLINTANTYPKTPLYKFGKTDPMKFLVKNEKINFLVKKHEKHIARDQLFQVSVLKSQRQHSAPASKKWYPGS